MASGKTYLVGNKSLFRVYDHQTSVWSDYSSLTENVYLTDVKTDYINPNYAITCGLNYLTYTINGGVTRTTAVVDTPSIPRLFQISIPTTVSQTIYVCGSAGQNSSGTILKSIDGGLTYVTITNGIDPTGLNVAHTIHFKDNSVGVVGHSTFIAKTVDGGDNWTYLNGGNPITKYLVTGIHISADEQVIVAVTTRNIYRSTDAGASFTNIYNIIAGDPNYEGKPSKYCHLTWYDDNTMWVSASNGPILYSADAGATWTSVYPALPIGSDTRTIFASHFYTPTIGFFGVNDIAQNTAALFSATNAGSSIIASLSNDYYPNYISTAVWTLVNEDIYVLYDCQEKANPIYTNNPELSAVTGSVIKIEGSSLCWQVSSVEFQGQTLTNVNIAVNDYNIPQIFDDCECCLPPVPPEPVKYTRVIPKPDRQFYQITQSQCDIQGNIKFAEAYYRLFKNLKYGINSQCDTVNLENLWIKKQLSDLAVINDPTACTITTPVTPVICPEPS